MGLSGSAPKKGKGIQTEAKFKDKKTRLNSKDQISSKNHREQHMAAL
jgi:hypothetical protein